MFAEGAVPTDSGIGLGIGSAVQRLSDTQTCSTGTNWGKLCGTLRKAID